MRAAMIGMAVVLGLTLSRGAWMGLGADLLCSQAVRVAHGLASRKHRRRPRA